MGAYETSSFTDVYEVCGYDAPVKTLGTRLTLLVAMTFATAPAVAQDWGNFAMISSSLGVNANRVCVGEGLRASDIGCPTYAPTVSSNGNVGISNTNPIAQLDVRGTISASDAIQVSGSSIACSIATKGAIRYSNASNTLEYCNSTAWVSAGPSATLVPAFSVNRNNTNLTVPASIDSLVSWTVEVFDTNNNFSGSRFTPTVPGKYLVTGSVRCNASDNCQAQIRKNGIIATRGISFGSSTVRVAPATGILDMNGTTDYLELYSFSSADTTLVGENATTFFQGYLINGGGSGGAGGSANPAGSTADVQFNNAGALAADTSNFTYSSGLLTSPRVSATAISATLGQFSSVSLTTGGINWGYLTSTNSFLPIVTGNLVSSTYVSASVVQVSGSGLACAANTKGAIRYSNTSNTLEYCNSTTWVSAGPSGTVVPAFSVNKNGTNQTVSTGVDVLLNWTTEVFDTNNNFASNRFTPTIPGKYLVSGAVRCESSTNCQTKIFKNGAVVTREYDGAATNMILTTQATAIVDMNGTTDYVELYTYEAPGGTISGVTHDTYFQGILISMAGGGSGGTATPAGSTNDVQFNTGGVLDADSGLFTYLKTSGSVSSTRVSTTLISATLVQLSSPSGAIGCSTNTLNSIRSNPLTGAIQVCVSR